MKVFRLGADVENYRMFGFSETAGVDWMLSLTSPAPVAADYRPFRIEPLEDDLNAGKPYGDFPYAGGVPAFSARAVDVLLELLAESGEILPLKSAIGEYYAFHPTRTADALEVGACDLLRSSTGHILDARRLVFRGEQLEGVPIFQVPELPTIVDILSLRTSDGGSYQPGWKALTCR